VRHVLAPLARKSWSGAPRLGASGRVFGFLLLGLWVARAQIQIIHEHLDNNHASAGFPFSRGPAPVADDAATPARFSLVDGTPDLNSGGLARLNDGVVPRVEDDPDKNFFFDAGTEGGRIQVLLPRELNLWQVATFSWHPNTRAAQVYRLYASDGQSPALVAEPRNGVEPGTCGWKLLAVVDTRPKTGEVGGQHGVFIKTADGSPLGRFRYLLFDISRTESDDDYGNTFYSEIDLYEQPATEPAGAAPSGASGSSSSKVQPAGEDRVSSSRAPR